MIYIPYIHYTRLAREKKKRVYIPSQDLQAFSHTQDECSPEHTYNRHKL